MGKTIPDIYRVSTNFPSCLKALLAIRFAGSMLYSPTLGVLDRENRQLVECIRVLALLNSSIPDRRCNEQSPAPFCPSRAQSLTCSPPVERRCWFSSPIERF
jgi:hypothetical protein